MVSGDIWFIQHIAPHFWLLVLTMIQKNHPALLFVPICAHSVLTMIFKLPLEQDESICVWASSTYSPILMGVVHFGFFYD